MATQQADSRNAKQNLQRVRRNSELRALGAGGERADRRDLLHRRRAPQYEKQRQHRRDADEPDADMRQPPAGGRDKILQDRRPHGAGEIIARRADRDRDPAPPREPVGNIRHQRTEGGRSPEADQPMRQGEQPEARCEPRGQVTERKASGAKQDRRDDPEPVGKPPHDDPAGAEAHHGERVGQGGVGAGDPEIGLHRRQRHDDRPHADTADRAEQTARCLAETKHRPIPAARCDGTCDAGADHGGGQSCPGARRSSRRF
jgi:hypothetical protein